MNKKNYIKRTALPVALFFSMVTLVPALGFQPASAAIDKVQQQSAIKGIVVDEKGEPIIGANVVAEGTTTGTITDIDFMLVNEALRPRSNPYLYLVASSI